MTVESELHVAIEAVQAATALVREQEAKIAKMKAASIDTSAAAALLAAYRAAARYATERRDWLQAQRKTKAG